MLNYFDVVLCPAEPGARADVPGEHLRAGGRGRGGGGGEQGAPREDCPQVSCVDLFQYFEGLMIDNLFVFPSSGIQ
jgi:hypothetical protein